MNVMRIIVPTDFSDAAWNAFLYAVNLALKIDAQELLILNSYKEPHAGAANIVSLEKILQEQSDSGLKEWLVKIEESSLGDQLPIKVKSIHSSLPDALNSQIQQYDRQVVVMGTLGETGSLEKLIGSNASAVVAKVKCPVLVIPPHVDFSFSGKIVLAADFVQSPEKADMSFLKKLISLHPSKKLDVVTVADDKEDSSKTVDLDAPLEGIPYQSQMISGHSVADTLADYVTKSKSTDLLVLIKRKKGLFERLFNESVTKKLVLHANIPLMILKAEE